MAHLILTRNHAYYRRSYRSCSDLRFRIGKITMSFFLLVLFVAVSFTYLAVSNGQITDGYQINQLESNKRKLIEDGQIISKKVDEALSLQNVQNLAFEKGMRSSKVFIYLEDKEKEVAVR
jgi:hypothetical protein